MKNNKESSAVRFTAKEDPAFAGMTAAFDVNKLSIPAALQQELDDAGYDYRWLNEAVYRQNYNMHKSGWKPYHVKNKRAMPSEIDSEGILRRGDLILGVRPKDLSNQHRQKINDANLRQSGKAMQKKKTEEFKQLMKDTGLSKYGAGNVVDDGDES